MVKVVLSGVGVHNKGAELMFYAVLQEIERKCPDAIVYVPTYSLDPYGRDYIQTQLQIKYVPYSLLVRLFNRLRLNKFKEFFSRKVVKDANYFIDCSGFLFSDQFNISNNAIRKLECVLKQYKKQNTKIIYLPQAFGPLKNKNSIDVVSVLGKYGDLIFAREQISYNYLKDVEFPDEKLYCKTDFTSLVEPVCDISLNDDYVCVIPNERMISMNVIPLDDYIRILKGVVDLSHSKGFKVYFLDHGGLKDQELIKKIVKTIDAANIKVLLGLNALDVKKYISRSYLCISSRFHGVASSLNSCVPCLATSWSHKYKELYKDYGLDDMILPITDYNETMNIVNRYLNCDKNKEIRLHLKIVKPSIQNEVRTMWNIIWNK